MVLVHEPALRAGQLGEVIGAAQGGHEEPRLVPLLRVNLVGAPPILGKLDVCADILALDNAPTNPGFSFSVPGSPSLYS